MQFLCQSTASQLVMIGPLAKSADGTAQTGQTIANTDIKIRKNAGTSLVSKNSGGATELASGTYYATLDATDTDTLGRLEIIVALASTLVWRSSYMVLPDFIYNALIAGTDLSIFGIIHQGTAQSADGTHLQLAASAPFADGEIVGASALIRSASAGAGQSRIVTGHVGSTDTAAVDTWTTTPSGTIKYMLFGSPPGSTGNPVQADITKWNGTAVSTPATAGIPEVNIKNVNNVAASSVTTVNANLGTTQPVNFTGTGASALAKGDVVDIAGAAVSASTAQLGVNVVNWKGSVAPAMTGDAFARIGAPAGASVSADVAAVKVDTAAIKTKTDQLVFTKTNEVDANIQSINGVTVTGDGSSGNKFGV